MATSLLEKMLKAGTVKYANRLSDSKFFAEKDIVTTSVPIVNVAFSGELDGGLVPGLTVISGESKSFKTMISLYCMKAYLQKYPDGIALFYDSEFGVTPEYLSNQGIDTSRVIHIPVEHIEQLKFDMVKRLESIDRDDRVFIMIDSLGAIPSKKEVDDALDEKAVADMTRAKALRSLLRIITPQLTMKNLPCVAIAHVYKTMELYAKNVVGGGSSLVYSANQVFIISRSQDKQADEIAGWNFTINIEKSRFVKEKAKLTFNVNYEKGISKWSGLMDLAKEFGFVTCPVQGWYSRVGEDKKWRLKDTECKEFWMPILSDKSFRDSVAKKFKVSSGSLDQFSENEAAEIIEEILDSEDEV